VFLAVQNAREWNRFCTDVLQLPEVTDDPSFRTNQLRTANREALHAIINQVLRELPTDTLVDRLERAGIAYSRMNSVAEFLDHPQLITRGRWQEIESEAGPVRALKPPVLIDGINPVMGRVPALGEHTRAILEELGFDRPTLDRWKQEHFV
jgi:crotonobetainyl-CoA:carnitine CoA-transferase CaiB-like acyl-CoA transferase